MFPLLKSLELGIIQKRLEDTKDPTDEGINDDDDAVKNNNSEFPSNFSSSRLTNLYPIIQVVISGLSFQ